LHNLKDFARSRWFHVLLILVWLAVGAGFRFANLSAKPPWTDEFATLVFSLGHSFTTVPLDRAISLEALMQPLQPTAAANTTTVTQYLLAEDVHPPLYFMLAHWWLRLFPSQDGLVSLWAARSLPALLGTFSIPAMFGLGWLAFRSTTAGHFAAAMMAISPFGIYLSQEARHYSLAILWVIACLCGLSLAVRSLQSQMPLSFGIVIVWIGINALGLATHHFFLLTLVAVAVALGSISIAQTWHDRTALLRSPWQRLYFVAFGTLASSLVWLPLWQGIRSHEITQWIQSEDRFSILSLLNPIAQSIAAWITMLVLLPVESSLLPVILIAGLAMILFLLWCLPLLWRGLSQLRSQPQTRLSVDGLGGFVLSAIALFFLITYGLGTDLTRGARYNFVYFPGVIALIGASLMVLWTEQTARSAPISADPLLVTASGEDRTNADAAIASLPAAKPSRSFSFAGFSRPNGRAAVLLIGLTGLLSGLTVVSNFGYQKYYRPDILVPFIQRQSQHPVLIATTHNTLVQTGELMGIGWQFLRQDRAELSRSIAQPQFLLAHQNQITCTADCEATATLHRALAQLTMPIDLWLVNFNASADLESQGCAIAESSPTAPYASGYAYEHYHCPGVGGNFRG
jgi:uncharacterized membrane protein